MRTFRIFLFLCLFPLALFAQEKSKPVPSWFSEKPTGLYNVTTFSFNAFGGPVLNGFRTSFGYKFNPHFGIGGGAGLERYVGMRTYDTLNCNLSMLPIFAEARYTVLDTKFSPVIALQGGYNILLNIPNSQMDYGISMTLPGYPWNEWFEYDQYSRGGWFLSAEAGVRMKTWKRTSIVLTFDYSWWKIGGDHYLWIYQHIPNTTGETVNNWYFSETTIAYVQSFLFRIGFCF